MDPLLDILTTYWKFPAFRPLQEEIIRSVLQGKDTLALLPTGGGKSLCFQVPALAKPGLCLVITPLIALMKDQVAELRRKNITAFALYSGMNRKAVINTLELAANSNCKFLYVSPERLETNIFKEYMAGLPVNLIAVDEAHCVSQWGYDFRPTYLRIAALRDELPGVSLLALTASATPEVQTDIMDKLGMTKPAVFRQSFERPNLSYSVFGMGRDREGKTGKIIEILQNVPGSGIVYCRSRKEAERLSDILQEQGVKAACYHAGLSQERRSEAQQAWMKDEIRIMVSTNAFGMGIDKAGVRTVIHAEVPDSIEAYYQEAGRAGRDGEKAYAVLLFDREELAYLASLPDTKFPVMAKIRIVYQALMNYLQVPSSSGEGAYYEFDLTVFCKSFRLERQVVLAVLSILGQEDVLVYLDQPYLPARVRFLADRPALTLFQEGYPALRPVVDTLLRTYEGMLDRPVVVYERQLGALLKKDSGEIEENLLRLHRAGVIEYIPVRNKPLIFFLRDRVPAEDLYIEPLAYQRRKGQYGARIGRVLEYLQLPGGCRSRYLAVYFGDAKARDCGICDNCLQRKREEKNQKK
ncbi:MAG: RecQ family ATP-dependent DNA helicase [Puia sp.]|nr:RecQ family ATP-dependent DNA helicase [Puia sp.]